MANPQKEDGYTEIANEILEALWKVNLSAYETRVLIFLIRKTYGWHKKTDTISLSQFQKEIGIDRRLIHRTLKELSSKGMIVVIPQDDRKSVKYGFQKDYQKWILSSPKMTHRKAVIPQDDKLSSKGIPTKEIKDKTYTPNFLSFWNLYPKKIGKGKAWQEWKKIKPNESLLLTMQITIGKFKETDQWKKENGQYIPNPATWLHQKRWEDEIPEVKNGKSW